MVSIQNFTPRLYQEKIVNSCSLKNTLIVLPTGMGKTKTSIIVAIERIQKYPDSRVLFLTPTKPLASQIQEEFQECTNVNNNEILLFTGAIAPKKRQLLEKEAKIIISTPQTISNDLINERIKLTDFSLLVIDEAHRATGDYDYVWIAKNYLQKASHPRIIALTASPGSDMETIKEVCKNLYIEEIEVKTEDDVDVKPYIQELNIDWIKVELGKEFLEIKSHLEETKAARIVQLKQLINLNTSNFTKKDLLSMMAQLQGKAARGDRDFASLRAISVISELMKIEHAIDLLETQGLEPLYTYLQTIFKDAEKTKTKSILNLVKDPSFFTAFTKTRSYNDKKIQHPKLIELKKIITTEIEKNPNIKIIIFNQYRDSAKNIEEVVDSIQNIKPKVFVGQAKKNGSGLSQKKQIEMLDDFRKNIINCIISTSIGEEGLDIPKVDLVIFYEPIPSAIRSIQRRGRTARTEKGKVIIMITKNTRDEIYHWVSKNKEKNMHKTLKDLKNKLTLNSFEEQPLKQFEEKNQLKIIADSREANSPIMKELVSQGITIETKSLEVGDYLISNRVCIERKTVEDFVNSIIDKRLIFQLKHLRNNFENPLIIIEGENDIYSVRNIHPNAIRGMLATIAISFSIPILYTKSPQDTVALLKTIAKREQDDEKKDFSLRVEKKPLTTKEMQQFIVESFPNIGPTTAKQLLRELNTIKNIVNADEETLKKVDGMGETRASEIKKLMDEYYRD